MLRLIGLGLSIDFIPLGNLKKLLMCDKIIVDSYTSVWFPHIGILIKLLLDMKKEVVVAKRDMLEGKAIDSILGESSRRDVCIAVIGDPLIATTHHTIVVEALKKGVEIDVSPATSIFNTAISISCLQAYRFGKIATIVSSKNGIVYEYPLIVLKNNRSQNLHTLFLLEVDVEQGYYMKPNEAVKTLIDIQKRQGEDILSNNDIVIVIADALSNRQRIVVLKMEEVIKKEFTENTLYTLIIPAKSLHPIEEECLKMLSNKELYKPALNEKDLNNITKSLFKEANCN
ncbi:MAG: diphthine synthase [Ignisphaera sp.]